MRRVLALAGLLALWCLPAFAQVGLPWPGPGTAHSAGGGSPWTLTAHGAVAGAASGTTSALNTTGAKLFVIVIGCYEGGGGHCDQTNTNVSDSSGNTYTRVATGAVLNTFDFEIYYKISPTTSSTETFSFTCGGINCFAAMEVQAWTEAGTPTFDTGIDSFGSASASSTTTGSITPSVNNALVVSGAVYDATSGSSFSVTGGFTISDQQALVPSTNEGGAAGYLLQSTAAAANPTWSATTGTTFIAGIASFKP